MLEALYQKGYQLVVGTNGKTATQKTRLKLTGFYRYFEHIIISEEMVMPKPSQLFEHIVALYPEQTKDAFLLVGDTLSTDILGAHQVDIASVWLNQSGQQALGKAYQPTYTIS